MPHETRKLFVEMAAKGPIYEHVFVESLGGRRCRIHASPALLSGLATGDEIELDETDPTRYRLVRQGGNVAVQVFCDDPVSVRKLLEPRFQALGGATDSGQKKAIVFSFPRSQGLERARAIMAEAERSFSELEWMFGNT